MSSEKEAEARKSSSEEISREFKTLVNSGDLHSLNHMQHTILGRLQDSNAVLSHFNDFSQHCFAEISGDIARNTRILKSVKSDLDYIFQKLRYSFLFSSSLCFLFVAITASPFKIVWYLLLHHSFTVFASPTCCLDIRGPAERSGFGPR